MFSLLLNLIFTLFTYAFALLTVTLLILKVRSLITKRMCKSKARLDGKVALITGGNAGIGLETARDLARRGATVVIASRNEEKSAKAAADIIDTTGNKKVEHRYLDLGRFSSVRKFAEEFNNSYDRLDILVNNSGTGGLKHRLTEDGIDYVTQVNYFGPFLLTHLLLNKIIASRPSRIVMVSSKAHQFAKPDFEDLRCEAMKPWYTIYSNTKLYNILWAKALARKVPQGVTVNALHPGIVKSEIFDVLGPIKRKIVVTFIGAIYKTPEEGAQTSIHVAVSEDTKHITGKYFIDCQIGDESKLAQNEELIKEVWERSLLITKAK